MLQKEYLNTLWCFLIVCLLINEKAAFLNLKYTCYRKRYYSTPVSFLWGYLNKKDIFNKDVYII